MMGYRRWRSSMGQFHYAAPCLSLWVNGLHRYWLLGTSRIAHSYIYRLSLVPRWLVAARPTPNFVGARGTTINLHLVHKTFKAIAKQYREGIQAYLGSI